MKYLYNITKDSSHQVTSLELNDGNPDLPRNFPHDPHVRRGGELDLRHPVYFFSHQL